MRKGSGHNGTRLLGSDAIHVFFFWSCFSGILLIHVLSNLVWLELDQRPIRTDEETHMEAAREYFEAFTLPEHDTFMKRVVAMAKVQPGNPVHPPLLHILGALMIMLFGYSTDIIAATGTPLFVLALIGCYALARRFLSPWHALYAMLLVSLTPIVYCASRYFMTDFAAMTLSVWALYALLRTRYLQHTGWVLAFAVLNGFAALARTQTFLFYLLPSVVLAVLGFVSVFRFRPTPSVNGPALRRLLLNLSVTVVVSLGVAVPWHARNLDHLYDFWTRDHQGGTGGPIALFQPQAPKSQAPFSATESEPLPAASSEGEETGSFVRAENHPLRRSFWPVFQRFQNPRIPWIRYPMHLLNNGFFLPLFVLSLLGMGTALLLGKFRNETVVALILGVLGSWVAMTLVFKYSNPRYALPVAPSLALFSVIPLLAVPRTWLRRILMGFTAAALVTQFVLLSFLPVGRIDITCSIDPPARELFHDPGLVLYKDELVISDAYCPMGPPLQENFKDRLFDALIRAEAKRSSLDASFANYQRLGVRGMEFDEKHYWSKPNPYLRTDLPAELIPKRKLRSIGMGYAAEEMLPGLASTDYIVYGIEQGQSAQESAWLEFFNHRGFSPVERFLTERHGRVPACVFGVLGRQPDQITSVEQIDKLGKYDLCLALESPAFLNWREELAEYAAVRFDKLLRRDFAPQEICKQFTCVAADLVRSEETTYTYSFIFHVKEALNDDWNVFLQGEVEPENSAALPAWRQGKGSMFWQITPDPPTSTWKTDHFVVVTKRLHNAHPIPYKMSCGFYQPGNKWKFLGCVAELGWVDFDQQSIAAESK